MADTRSTSSRTAARNQAQSFFTATEQRDQTIKQMLTAERAATDAKTAKLRALRLAKEETERLAAADAPVVPKKPAKPTVRMRKVPKS